MKYSKAADYALHAVEMMIEQDGGENVGLQDMAASLGVSPTYLSKILTKLVKAGLLTSVCGAAGGYRLARKKEDISFLDVIKAVEGSGTLYSPVVADREDCRIHQIMYEAESLMFRYLEQHKIIEVTEGGS